MSKSCEQCYWNWCKLAGCPDASKGCVCNDYYPNDFDEEFTTVELAYEVAPEGTWEQMGFTIEVHE